MSRKMAGRKCYFCGRPATGREHVPPDQMFRGFECDRITVPSCAQHNGQKSGADQAVIASLLHSLDNSRKLGVVGPDIEQAIKLGVASLERVKRKVIDAPLLREMPDSLQGLPNVAYLVPGVDIYSWIRQLTAAVIYDAVQAHYNSLDWFEMRIWSPEWISSPGPAALMLNEVYDVMKRHEEVKTKLEELKWVDGWSASPRPYPKSIYFFQVNFETNGQVGIKHTLYSFYTWYTWFEAPKSVIAKLWNKLL